MGFLYERIMQINVIVLFSGDRGMFEVPVNEVYKMKTGDYHIYRDTESINLSAMYLMHETVVGVRRKVAMQ